MASGSKHSHSTKGAAMTQGLVPHRLGDIERMLGSIDKLLMRTEEREEVKLLNEARSSLGILAASLRLQQQTRKDGTR